MTDEIGILLEKYESLIMDKKSIDETIKRIKESLEKRMVKGNETSITKELDNGNRWNVSIKNSSRETVTKLGKNYLHDQIFGQERFNYVDYIKKTNVKSITIRKV